MRVLKQRIPQKKALILSFKVTPWKWVLALSWGCHLLYHWLTSFTNKSIDVPFKKKGDFIKFCGLLRIAVNELYLISSVSLSRLLICTSFNPKNFCNWHETFPRCTFTCTLFIYIAGNRGKVELVHGLQTNDG